MTQFMANSFSWGDSDAFDQNYGIISADPEELFEGLSTIRSICDDIRLLESRESDLPGSETSDFEDMISPPEIRNYNCMWSGKSSPFSASNTMLQMDSVVSAVPLAAIIGNSEKPPATIIKAEPIEETENQQRATPRANQQQPQQHQQLTNQQSMQKIPPGTSLLLNSRKTTTPTTTTTQQQTQQPQQINKKSKSNSIVIPLIPPSDFLRNRTLIASPASPTFGRPDTPHSLDDDATEFKHSYDLTACVMGSNNISLLEGNDPEKIMAINRLREQLEDTNKKIVTSHTGSLADVLSIIDKDSISSSNCHIKQEEDEDDTYFDRQHSYTGSQQQNSNIDWDSSDDGSSLDGDAISSKRSGCSSSLSFLSTPISNSSNIYPIKHSDHSYTRSKDGIDDISPNLETPSDSDEEIDVVSIGDKKLPTNPSDKDRRALQTKVAHKFSTAHIVKTPNGIRTIPPRRRVSYDLPYTPASISPVKSGSSLANSRYPSPTSTPYSSSSQYSSSSSSSSSSSKYHHHSSSSRKRIATNCSIRTSGSGNVIINGSNSDEFMPPSKRHRGKKQKALANVPIKRHYSVDEVDTTEKRNLHNDMERQRRIGLKNLFEALKKQIPSIKDKERAPKVNILREAAKLCENLTREEQHLSDQKDKLREQLRKRQEILSQLRMRQNAARGC